MNNDLKVTVTGPTTTSDNNTYSLKSGDVEFSTDGQTWTTDLPTNAATYQVRLTAQGEQGIQDQFGNNSIVWTQDGKSTITSNASWTIDKLATDSVMNNAQAGNYSQTYNGTAPSSIDPSKFAFTTQVNGKTVILTANDLTSGDFTWVDGSAPVNVGTYQIKLTDAGFAKLQADNPNFTLTNTVEGTFTITQANATAVLSGSGTRAYNGSAVTVDDLNVSNDGNNITLTLHYPKDGNANYSTAVKLSDGDYAWNTPDGKAPVDANDQAYTLTLKPAAIQKIIADAVGTGQNGQSNVKFADGAISGSASYTITPLASKATLANTQEGNYSKVYDAQITDQIDSTKLQLTAVVDGKTVVLSTNGIDGNSYQWVNATGSALKNNPKNVGTYYIKLTSDAFKTLQADNPNFTLTNTGLGVYTITQANATASLSGSNSKVYDGQAITVDQANGGTIKVNLSYPGANTATYTLQAGEYTISGNATDAGDYTITLTDQGITNIENSIKSLVGTGQKNQSNVTFANDAITGTATFTIEKSKNVVSAGSTQTETYNGSPISVVYNATGANSVTVSIAKADGNTTGATGDLRKVTLDSGDFEIIDGPAEKAGSYKVALADTGLQKIQEALGGNFDVSVNNDVTGTLQIDKAPASAEFLGSPTKPYDGSAITDYWEKFTIKLNEPNNPTYTLTAKDLEFSTDGENWTSVAPVNVGKYKVRLSAQGWRNIKAINSDNVAWPENASVADGSYEITPAKVTAELTGNNSMIYSGKAANTSDLNAGDSTIKVVISSDGVANLPKSYTLTDDDYEWIDGSAPVNVGNYQLKLTQAGLGKIQTLINKAVGNGNAVVTTPPTPDKTASFRIDQAVANNVQLYGNEQSNYNGQAVNFDPTDVGTKKNYGFHNVEGLTIPDLTGDEFKWVDNDGNPISAPTNAGTYYLQLNDSGKQAIANANTNYTFVDGNGDSTITGRITYVVNKADLTITVSGTGTKVYDGKNAQVANDQIDKAIQLIWSSSNDAPVLELGDFKFTSADFEVIEANGIAAVNANADKDVKDGNPTYYVRLTDAALEKIRSLPGANNYNISKASNATYLIYTRKAQLTLSGSQTTTYGTVLQFDPSKYTLDFSNWIDQSNPKPTKDQIGLGKGDLYIKFANNNGSSSDVLPTDVGSYQVAISNKLLKRLEKAFPNYDFDAINVESLASLANGQNRTIQGVDASHTGGAKYVIDPAVTTVTINGAQHVKYGESNTLKYGQDGYTISITAPVKNAEIDNPKQPIYTSLALTDGDLEFVATPGKVGDYQVKLSAQGLKKLHDLTGSTNYDWKQAAEARANFFVDQMPVTITVGGDPQSVVYGSQKWLTSIKSNPSGYTLTVTTDNGTKLDYTAKSGDLVFDQTPGNVGNYQVELSAQGLQNIEQALGTNYEYPQTAADVTTKGTFTVKQGEVTVTLNNGKNGSDGKTYDASQTTASNLNLNKYNVGYSVDVYSANGKKQVLTLTNDDLQIVDNATNVGHYTVELSQTGQDKLKQLTGNNGANYNWTFNSNADYTITAATATAELRGSNDKQFDGHAVTTDEVNKDDKILVHFTYPGSTELSTYALQDGDYTWNTPDGKAPTNVGDSYSITLNKDKILSHLQDRLTELNGTGQNGQSNVTITDNDLLGQATFMITPKPVTNVTISGDDQTKVYDGNGAGLDVSSLKISGDGVVDGTPLADTEITAGDFDWYDASGNKLDAAPVNVGDYSAHLKDSARVILQHANPNYTFNAASGVINYSITPKSATAAMGGNGGRKYNSNGTSAADVLNKVTWKGTDFIPGQTLNINSLTVDDYAWYIQNADGTYTAMTGDPVNAGTYYLKLKDGSLDRIKSDNPNYSFAANAISGQFTYTIKSVSGTATLSGGNHKIYNGKAVTNDEVISPSGTIKVTFGFPGSTDKSTYVLQNGDYTWRTTDNIAPTNAGTYTLTLSEQGLSHLQAAIDKYVGSGNVNLTAKNIKGSATFTIDKKSIIVDLIDRSTTPGSKTYDGQTATIDPNTAKYDASGLLTGESLNINNLTASDYKWVNEAGNKIDAPKNAGTYYIILNTDGLKQLQKDNPNYEITEQGRFKYVISPKTVNVSISGSQESTDTKIDAGKYSLTVPAGIAIPTGLTYQFASGNVPKESGTYMISLSPEGLTALEKANPNYKLNISSTAEFTLDATVTIVFQDADENNKQVGDETTKTGVADSTVDLSLIVPDNYELATDETLPTSYKFNKTLQQTVYIKLVHKTKPVDPTDPKTNPTEDENWFKENDLVKDVTRTINYKGLSDAQLAEIPADQKSQTAHFTRTAKYDLVTGKLVKGSEGAWTPVSGNLAGFTPRKFNGYTADQNVPDLEVTGDSTVSPITITYKANKQSLVIKFVDDDKSGSQVGSDITKTGATDQTITDFNDVKVPDHYELANGQKLPTSYKFTAAKDQAITIHLIEKKVTVDPTKPESNPKPKDKNWFAEEGLSHTATRTIKLADGTVVEAQPATITRTATYNEVTGKLTNFSEWTKASWDAYQVTDKPGYTTTIEQTIDGQTTKISSIDTVSITPDTKSVIIMISYTANKQTGKISYVDGNGNEIGTDPLTGKTDETITVTPENIPEGWKLVPDQDIPKKIKVTPDGVPTVTIKIQHKTIVVTPETPKSDIPTGKVPGDPTKTYEKIDSLTVTPTRTIIVEMPDGTKQTIPQKVEFTRTATFDEVTGKVTYSNWKIAKSDAQDKSAQWDAYKAPTVDGYTASPTVVAAQAVEATTDNTTATITYTKNAPNPGPGPQPGPQPGPAPTPTPTPKPVPEPKPKPKPTLEIKPVPKPKPGQLSYDKPETIVIPETEKTVETYKATEKAKVKGYTETNAPLHEDVDKWKRSASLASREDQINGPVLPMNQPMAADAQRQAEAEALKAEDATAKAEKGKLPQTGDKKNNSFLSALGALLAGFGVFGLIDRKKKKDE